MAQTKRAKLACLRLAPREFDRLKRDGVLQFDLDLSNLVVRRDGVDLQSLRVSAAAEETPPIGAVAIEIQRGIGWDAVRLELRVVK